MTVIHPRPSRRILPVFFVAALLLSLGRTGFGQAAAAPAPPKTDEAQTFHRTLDYVVKVDGQAVPGVKSYVTERGDAYLIVVPKLGPVLLSLRSREVALLAQAPAEHGGLVALPAAAARKPVGQFEIAREAPVFTLDGRRVALEYPPPLLGLQPLAAVRAYNPDYDRKAASYQPDAAALAGLAAMKEPVRLRVYFGTWCPVCSRVLPNLFKVLDSLPKAPLTVELYGLPQDRDADPEPARMNLQGIPTGIVYRQGREIGRLTGQDWQQPEVALWQLLSAK